MYVQLGSSECFSALAPELGPGDLGPASLQVQAGSHPGEAFAELVFPSGLVTVGSMAVYFMDPCSLRAREGACVVPRKCTLCSLQIAQVAGAEHGSGAGQALQHPFFRAGRPFRGVSALCMLPFSSPVWFPTALTSLR